MRGPRRRRLGANRFSQSSVTYHGVFGSVFQVALDTITTAGQSERIRPAHSIRQRVRAFFEVSMLFLSRRRVFDARSQMRKVVIFFVAGGLRTTCPFRA